ncbi:MAG: sialidase family protein, partial [Fidelibacterota bacterium]
MYTWIKLHGAIVFSLWILVFSSQLIAVPNYQFEENFPIALEPDSMQNQRYPYIAIDENGVVHIVFVKISELGKNIYYCQSEDLGATFSSPTQINTISNHVSAFGIAGPKIGLRGEEVIVTWADNRAGSPKLFMVFSSDGGQTWSEDWGIDTDPEMQLYVDLAVDFEGRLYLAYYAYLDETGFLGIKYRFTEPWSFDFSPSLN